MMPYEPQSFFDSVRFIRYGVMHLARRMRLERGENPLGPSKLILLGWLLRNGPMTATELAARERVRPQSLTRTLANLEEDGLISRQASESDRRQSVIAITAQGGTALNHEMHQSDIWLAKMMTQRLSPTECEILRLATQLMERLSAPDPVPPRKEKP